MVRETKIQLGLFLLLLVGMTSGCKDDKKQEGALLRTPSFALTSGKNIDVIFSDSGRVQARITGPLVNRFSGDYPYVEFPRGFKVSTYDSALRVVTTITGDYGKRNDNTRIMEARGNVVVRNEIKQEQLETEMLTWDERKHTITTNVPVKIVTLDKVLYGDGLESNESFTNYRIIRPRGQMIVKKDSI